MLIIQDSASNLIEQIGLSILLALKNTNLIGITGHLNKITMEEYLQIEDFH